MDKGETKKPSLDTILYVPFYKCLLADSGDGLNLDSDAFHALKIEYFKYLNIVLRGTEKQIKFLDIDLDILESCLLILTYSGYNQDIADIVADFNVELTATDYISKTVELVELITNKRNSMKLLRSLLPPMEKQKPQTAYDVLAKLAIQLEQPIGNFRQITVMDYIGYSNALKHKIAVVKEQARKQRKRHGRRKN